MSLNSPYNIGPRSTTGFRPTTDLVLAFSASETYIDATGNHPGYLGLAPTDLHGIHLYFLGVMLVGGGLQGVLESSENFVHDCHGGRRIREQSIDYHALVQHRFRPLISSFIIKVGEPDLSSVHGPHDGTGDESAVLVNRPSDLCDVQLDCLSVTSWDLVGTSS